MQIYKRFNLSCSSCFYNFSASFFSSAALSNGVCPSFFLAFLFSAPLVIKRSLDMKFDFCKLYTHDSKNVLQSGNDLLSIVRWMIPYDLHRFLVKQSIHESDEGEQVGELVLEVFDFQGVWRVNELLLQIGPRYYIKWCDLWSFLLDLWSWHLLNVLFFILFKNLVFFDLFIYLIIEEAALLAQQPTEFLMNIPGSSKPLNVHAKVLHLCRILPIVIEVKPGHQGFNRVRHVIYQWSVVVSQLTLMEVQFLQR